MPDSEFPVVRTLLIEDDEDDCVLIRSVLSEVTSARYETTWVKTYGEAVRELKNGNHDVCLLDYRLGNRNGLEILQKVSDCPDKPPIIILTGQGDYNVDVEAMKWGAADYLLKDQINEGTLERTIRYAIERRKSEAALRQSEKQLNYLSSQLLVVQENERRKVAAELHDNLGQVLSAIKYNIESVLSRMPAGDSLTCELAQVIPLIQGAVEHVRNIYTQLRPTLLDDLGVEATLNWYCREFESAHEGIHVDKEFGVAEETIPESLKLVIFRIVQDAMENVATHSCARNVWISLKSEKGKFRLDIRDDGIGFDVSEILSRARPGGLGLRSMQRRAELSGGMLEVFSKAGMGTSVRAVWAEKDIKS